MNHDETPLKADALDAFLDRQELSEPNPLSESELTFTVQLQEMVKALQADPRFTAHLGHQLRLATQQKQQLRASSDKRFRWYTKLGYAVMITCALILLLIWLPANHFREVFQSPTPKQEAMVSQSQPSLLISEAAPLLPFLPMLNPRPAQAAESANGLFPGTDLILMAAFPPAPEQATVYLQQPGEMLTQENTSHIAELLGVRGTLYHSSITNPSGFDNIVISDGIHRLRFDGSPLRFTYESESQAVFAPFCSGIPFDRAATIAETFLRSRNLLNFEYHAEPVEDCPGRLTFVQVIDGIPVNSSTIPSPLRDNVYIEVLVSQAEQVEYLVYRHPTSFRPIGAYPIRSAQEAWEAILSGEGLGISQEEFYQPGNAMGAQLYTRPYRAGERIELAGQVELLRPLDASSEPRLFLIPYTPPLISLHGSPASSRISIHKLSLSRQSQAPLEQVLADETISVQGILAEKADGGLELQVSTWEQPAPLNELLFGHVQRQSNQGWIITEGGERLYLPDLPADLDNGAAVRAYGLRSVANPEVFEWTLIEAEPEGGFPGGIYPESGFGGGGGGGGGESPFGEVAEDITPEPTPTPMYQNGQAVDGLTGFLTVVNYIYPDGSKGVEHTLFSHSPSMQDQIWLFRLEGEGLSGIEAFHNQHVRVWGQYHTSAGLPSIAVEHYEKAYPEEKIQAWLGEEKLTILEGKNAILFTSLMGEQFVLESSIGAPSNELNASLPKGRVLLEGIYLSDVKLGGYAVVTDLTVVPKPDMDSLDSYQIQSSQPPLVDLSQFGQRTAGSVTIDKIELIYLAFDFPNSVGAPDSIAKYVQPMWAFSGHLQDGSYIRILVQAVVDQYLR